MFFNNRSSFLVIIFFCLSVFSNEISLNSKHTCYSNKNEINCVGSNYPYDDGYHKDLKNITDLTSGAGHYSGLTHLNF